MKHLNHLTFIVCTSILIVLGLTVRFIWLDHFPPGMSHDELELILSAKTYFQSGVDISGSRFPLSIFNTQLEAKSTGVVSILLSPFFGLFLPTLSSTSFIYALINISSGLVGAGFLYHFIKNRYFILTFFAIFLLNPWMISYSKMSLAPPVSLFLLITGLYLLFKSHTHSRLLSLPFFCISALTYFGALFALPLLITPLVVIHSWLHGKSSLKTNIFIILSLLFFVATFITLSHSLPGSTLSRRLQEASTFNLNRYSSRVNDSRRQSIDFPLRQLFLNKFTAYVDDSLEKYFQAFAPSTLFFTGDPIAAYTFGLFGLFFPLSAPFILLGLIALYRHSKPLLLICLFLVVLSPTASLLNQTKSYIFRSFPLPFPLLTLCASGIWLAISRTPSKFRHLTTLIIFSFYLLFFLRFSVFYFFQYPILEGDNHFLSERVLVNYLIRNPEKIYVAVPSPVQIKNQYQFFSKTYSPDSLSTSPLFQLDHGRLTISSVCPKDNNYDVYILDTHLNCPPMSGSQTLIQDPKDAGVVYRIYNDQLCSSLLLPFWRPNHLLSDYAIESLSPAQFCTRWLTLPLSANQFYSKTISLHAQKAL